MIVSIARSSPFRAAAITATSPVSRQTRGCTCRASAAFDLDTLHLRPGRGSDHSKRDKRTLDDAEAERQVQLEAGSIALRSAVSRRNFPALRPTGRGGGARAPHERPRRPTPPP